MDGEWIYDALKTIMSRLIKDNLQKKDTTVVHKWADHPSALLEVHSVDV